MSASTKLTNYRTNAYGSCNEGIGLQQAKKMRAMFATSFDSTTQPSTTAAAQTATAKKTTAFSPVAQQQTTATPARSAPKPLAVVPQTATAQRTTASVNKRVVIEQGLVPMSPLVMSIVSALFG